jgi:HD-GYP domain-containing protein (c-di-GMP phosphodiesterase class II)
LAFAKALGLKDFYTGEHVEKTVHYAVRISQKLNFPKDKVELIRQAAMLHDLGKVGISDKILHKKSKLSKEEFEEIKRHPQIGVDIIRSIHSLRPVIPAVMHHHERWDGKGYPHGLKMLQIPLIARIISIADVYQALTSDRPYRKAYSKEKALGIIKKGSGTQFDPDIVNSFCEVLQEDG